MPSKVVFIVSYDTNFKVVCYNQCTSILNLLGFAAWMETYTQMNGKCKQMKKQPLDLNAELLSCLSSCLLL